MLGSYDEYPTDTKYGMQHIHYGVRRGMVFNLGERIAHDEQNKCLVPTTAEKEIMLGIGHGNRRSRPCDPCPAPAPAASKHLLRNCGEDFAPVAVMDSV